MAATAAQSATATLQGTVTDDTDAGVPDVEVTLMHLGTGLQREARTNASGSFVVPLLPPGRYRVVATRDGFRPAQVNELVLNVNDEIVIRLRLIVAQVGESVTVSAPPARVRNSSAVGTVVDRQFVENLPLNGRSFQSLLTLTPGVVTVPAGVANTGGQLSVNGQRASANNFTVDGVSANFAAAPAAVGAQTSGNLPGLTAFGTTQSLVSVDALQEFKVLTSTYAAEYGRQPGGQVSIVTRSGTNQFHGSAFDYVRHDAFDAKDWFIARAGGSKPPERQSDFGGTLGGPILIPRLYGGRDRTFFFFSYEGLRLRQPQFNLTNVPTLALRQQAPPAMQPILNAFPLPAADAKDLGNGLAEFRASYSNPSKLDATSLRIDHVVGPKLTLFARYTHSPSSETTRSADSNLALSRTSRLRTQTITVGATTLFSSRAVNDLRVNVSDNGAYTRRETDDFGGAIPPPRGALIPSQYDSDTASGYVQLVFTGLTAASIPIAQYSGTNTASQRQFNLTDNFTYAVGAHQFKAGLDYRRLAPVIAANPYTVGGTFSSQDRVRAGVADSATIYSAQPGYPIFQNFSAYAQDAWRVSPRLTLNLGVRWDVNPAPFDAEGRDQIAVTQIDDLATIALAPAGTRAWTTTYGNVAPRVGAAYELSRAAGRETVLRGGVGVFYDTGNDRGAQNALSSFPYGSTRTASAVAYPLSAVQVAPAPAAIDTGLTPPYGLFYAFDPSLQLPYTWHWNVTVEQSLGATQSLTVSYVGAAGRRLLQGTQTSLARINPDFTTIYLTTNKATSDYDALQAQFQRRLSRGLQALVSYTWAHALDDDSSSLGFLVARRGNASFDVRHVAAAAVTYDVPVPGRGAVMRALFDRWSLDVAYHAQSALPIDVSARTEVNPADGSLLNVRPNVNDGVPFYVDDPSLPGGRRINREAFSVPAPGTAGDLGRNVLRALPAWQVDLAVRRELPVVRPFRLQVRAEAFNLFNHPNFGTIQRSLTSPIFGQATDMLNRQLGGVSQLYQIGGPRSFQLAVKVLF